MFEFDKSTKQKDFVQEYLYLEDYSLYQQYLEDQISKEKNHEDSRGSVEIDLNNGKTIEIT